MAITNTKDLVNTEMFEDIPSYMTDMSELSLLTNRKG